MPGKVKTRNKGMDTKGLDCYSIQKEASDQIQKNERLRELGEKYVRDKETLEKEIEKVKAAKISEEAKTKLIGELEGAIRTIQEQYAEAIVEEESRVEEDLEIQLELMREMAEEFGQQADSLRDVQVEVVGKDASDAAAAEAEAQKTEFERMREEYGAKLQLQMEQAQMQRRKIMLRRLSGQ
ncbi:MAG: hypothetical protein IKV59_07400 [Lachnospiraceae bacterium]|nr:hypothetical protein [Lachnospiraceae bacterium]